VSQRIQRERWRLRLSTGYTPERVEIPRRFSEVVTWKGPIDTAYLDALRKEYSLRIRAMAAATEDDRTAGASTPHTP
jgi:aldehyde:ferredoxin oxidoreductase